MKNIRNELLWDNVDWSSLIGTKMNALKNLEVCEGDIDVFVENLYREISRKSNMPFEEIRQVLEAENEPFDRMKKRLFKCCSSYEKNDKRLKSLQETLRVPVMDNVLMCYDLFNNLSEMDKIIFLEKIGRIKIEYFE